MSNKLPTVPRRKLNELNGDEIRKIITDFAADAYIDDILTKYNITTKTLNRITEIHYKKLKESILKDSEDNILLEITKLKNVENALIKNCGENASSVTQLLKIQEKIDDLKKKLQNINIKQDPLDKRNLETELMRLKLDVQKKNLIPKEEVEFILNEIFNSLSFLMSDAWKEHQKYNCKCFDMLKENVKIISEKIKETEKVTEKESENVNSTEE